jgi:RHS repeat-associated protein
MDGFAGMGNLRDERERTSQYDAKFGFYEYRARAYNPTLGRFMSEDPKGFDAMLAGITRLSKKSDPLRADESEYNLYRYVDNSPLNFTDPTGSQDEDAPENLGREINPEAAQLNEVERAMREETPSARALRALNEKADAAMKEVQDSARLDAKIAQAMSKIQENDVHHIFGKADHNLESVEKEFGNAKAATQALIKAVQTAVTKGNLTGDLDITVKVGSTNVTVTGRIIDGVVRIGTAFVPKSSQ